MKHAIVYTGLSLLNLIGFVIGLLFLPEQVPIHFSVSMTADVVGTPWTFAALPAATAIISAGIWTAEITAKRHAKLIVTLLTITGGVLAILGWCFYALASSNVEIGQRTSFPILLITVLPISLLLIFFGDFLPGLVPNPIFGFYARETYKDENRWKKAHTFSGALFFSAGIIAGASSILFECLPTLRVFEYGAVIILVAATGLAIFSSELYARNLIKRQPQKKDEETP